MGFSESPSLDDFQKNGQLTPESPRRKRRTRAFLLVVIALVSFSFWYWSLLDSGTVNVVLRRGSLSGRIVNESGEPLAGEVFLLGDEIEVQTDSDGKFRLEDLPAGEQSVIVAYNGTAEEYPVVIPAGERIDVGDLVFPVVTQTPEGE